MKRAWKWVIGIVVGLLVIAALVSVPLLMHGRFLAGDFDGRGGWQGRELTPSFGPGGHMRGPGMMGYYGGMLSFGGLFMGLIQLGFLGLIVLGIVWLVRTLRQPKPAAVALGTCAKCGKPVQADWSNCPYCGKKQ